jgi:hypothetical protein
VCRAVTGGEYDNAFQVCGWTWQAATCTRPAAVLQCKGTHHLPLCSMLLIGRLGAWWQSCRQQLNES